MSSRTLATQPRPSSVRPFEHVVRFYEDDHFLIETVGRYLGSGLSRDGAAIALATKSHLDAIGEELALRGVDVGAAVEQGRYIALDAAETMASFMVEGWPDERRFAAKIGELIGRGQEAGGGDQRLAVFGEIVALLWTEGKRDAAVRLEQLWNRLAYAHSFSLFCAYPLGGFDREEHARLFFNICGEHSEVNPAEGYPGEGNESQRRRAVAQLQQETTALKNEIRLSQERILLLQRAAESGTWELDLLDDTISFSSKAAGMLEIPSGAFPLNRFLQLIHYSGDRDALLAALKRARTGRKEFVVEFRLKRDDGIHVLSIRGKAFYNNGQPLVIGVLSDVTPAV